MSGHLVCVGGLLYGWWELLRWRGLRCWCGLRCGCELRCGVAVFSVVVHHLECDVRRDSGLIESVKEAGDFHLIVFVRCFFVDVENVVFDVEADRVGVFL